MQLHDMQHGPMSLQIEQSSTYTLALTACDLMNAIAITVNAISTYMQRCVPGVLLHSQHICLKYSSEAFNLTNDNHDNAVNIRM